MYHSRIFKEMHVGKMPLFYLLGPNPTLPGLFWRWGAVGMNPSCDPWEIMVMMPKNRSGNVIIHQSARPKKISQYKSFIM